MFRGLYRTSLCAALVLLLAVPTCRKAPQPVLDNTDDGPRHLLPVDKNGQ